MAKSTPEFSIKVSEVRGLCPAGEFHAKQNIAENKLPSSLARGLEFAAKLIALFQTP